MATASFASSGSTAEYLRYIESVLWLVNFMVMTFGTLAFRMLVLNVYLNSWNVKCIIPGLLGQWSRLLSAERSKKS